MMERVREQLITYDAGKCARRPKNTKELDHFRVGEGAEVCNLFYDALQIVFRLNLLAVHGLCVKNLRVNYL